MRRADLVAFDGLSAPSLLAVIQRAAQEPDLVIGIAFTVLNQWEFVMQRLAVRARATHLGLAIAPGGLPAMTTALGALLEFHLLALRQRTPAQWAAARARATHGTASGAADALGCSRQSLAKTLRRGAVPTTAKTQAALAAILHLAAEAEAEPGATGIL